MAYWPNVYTICASLVCDDSNQVLDGDDNPIEGLYVCGNDSGCFFAHTYPDQIPGLAAGRSAVFARRAGRLAATGE